MKWTITLIANLLAFASLFANSENGFSISPTGTYRTLNIFINIIYDVRPDSNLFSGNTPFWPYTIVEGVATTGPTYFEDYIDVNYTTPANVNGLMTRIYHESSFGRLILLGDMLVVNVKQSTIDPFGGGFSSGELITTCNSIINVSGVNAAYGHNSISDYDSNSDNKVDFVQYFCRNGTVTYGLDYKDGGFTSSGGILKFNGTDRTIAFYSFQNADANIDISKRYKHLSIHEFAHNLFGPNDFHTSGGNHYFEPGTACTFMGLQGGWGLMGAANSSLVSCNGFERWRMNWTSPIYNPSALRIQANGVASDIDQSMGKRIFYLRDFVSTGDAIRIKLPYKDIIYSTNQYIWLENHQIGQNGKLDFFKYKDEACIPQGISGVYAYHQVGKDVISGSYYDIWPSNETDNLRVISAEGNWDMVFDGNQSDCLSWGNRVVVKQLEENPLSGYNDQMTVFYNTATNQLTGKVDDRFPVVKKYVDQTIDSALPHLGDNYDAFTHNTKMGIATNPPASNVVTYYANQNDGKIDPNNPNKNTRRVYLSGLQIMFEVFGADQFGSIYKVTIDWDKYDVDTDVRWTGDIVLKELVTLKQNKSIVFNQSRTPNQKYRSTSTGEFAEATVFSVKSGASFKMESNSKIVLDENSTFKLEAGSTFEIGDGAEFLVINSSKLIIETGANIIVKGKGAIVFKCGGSLCCNSGANINLQDKPSGIYFIDTGGLSIGCLSNISSVLTGDGEVRTYTSASSVSNRIISSDVAYIGNNISSTNVTIQGSGTDVIYSASNEVQINGTFEVPLGSTFVADIVSNPGCSDY